MTFEYERKEELYTEVELKKKAYDISERVAKEAYDTSLKCWDWHCKFYYLILCHSIVVLMFLFFYTSWCFSIKGCGDHFLPVTVSWLKCIVTFLIFVFNGMMIFQLRLPITWLAKNLIDSNTNPNLLKLNYAISAMRIVERIEEMTPWYFVYIGFLLVVLVFFTNFL